MFAVWSRACEQRIPTLALAVFCFMTALPALATERQVIPFGVNSNGHVIVPIKINGTTPAIGTVDTAATYAMIDAATAKAARIPPPDQITVNVLGLEGLQIFPVVQVDSLSAGNTRINDFSAALNEQVGVIGVGNVVPMTALEGDVVDFDFSESRILVYDGRPDRSTTLTTSRMPMNELQGLWFAEVRLNGVKGLALIDTGSSISYVNSRFAEDAGVKPNEEKTQTLRGITGDGIAIRVATARKFTLGQHRVTGPDLIVADPPLFAHLGMADDPVMVLGLDYLSVFRVQMDRRRGYLILGIPDTNGSTRGIRLNSGGSRIRTD